MIRILIGLMGADIMMVSVAWIWGRPEWLINTQIAFVNTTLILGASMLSYRQMVNRRLSDGGVIPEEQRGVLEKIEDPYALYEEDEAMEEREDVRQAITEEKRRMKQHRRSLMQTLKDSKASLSFVRLGAYLLLFVGFFYLSSHRLLDVPSYLLGLSLPIVTILMLLLSQKEETHEAGL